MSTFSEIEYQTRSESEFNRLLEKPAFSWPTFLLFVFIVANFCYATYSAVTGTMSILAAIAHNSLSAYIAYTIMHEAAHGLVCANKTVNDWVGRISLLAISVMPFFSTYRTLHMTHHRYVNDPKNDPDFFCCVGPAWLLPFRWMVMDVAYVTFFLKECYRHRPRAEKVEFWLAVIFGLTLLTAIIVSGHLMTFVLIYLIPTRIALFFLVLTFDYLPHYPHDTLADDNKFRATNNRVGMEWLITPLLLGQNYHLTHHLYPSAPFYRYRKVWQARQHFHDANNPALVKFYKLKPMQDMNN
ncbi:MAG: fatty acid desaturase [Burkholderiales bacterium]|nr:fatty acid desaturase [Burkholderiales bacterium]MDR4517416.1 fatty acid desaturase [Nitrosomonas sp.]